MKAKVYQYGAYPRNNQIVVHTIDIEQLAGDVYYYIVEKAATEPDNDNIGLVLHIGGNYFNFFRCSRRTINTPQDLENVKNITVNFEAYINSKMQNNQPVSLMDMKVFEKLGKDTTLLIRYQEQREAARIAMKEARKQKEEEKKLREIEQERLRLIKVKQDYMNGNEISGADFVDICRIDGFVIHIRTIGTLYKSIASLDKKGHMGIWKQKGKAKPKTDGVNILIKEYNAFLDKNKSQNE